MLLGFFVLAFAWAWGFWFAADAVSRGAGPAGPTLAMLRTPLFLIGTFAPSLVALALTARAEGRPGAAALFGRVFRGAGARWVVFAVTYLAAIKLTAALIHRLAAGAWPRFGTESWIIIPFAILVSTPVQAGEEIGWRGYALPRMAARIGLGPASLVLGVIWALWHLPLFFIAGADTAGQSFPLYLLEVVAISVTMAWLYGHARGSLLLVMLLHAAINNTKDIVPSHVPPGAPGAGDPFALSTSLLAWITVALLWVCAVAFLARMPRYDAAWTRDPGPGASGAPSPENPPKG